MTYFVDIVFLIKINFIDSPETEKNTKLLEENIENKRWWQWWK